ncbi:hypothetical protein COY25_02110 [Candidatus Uhrbacteria bacterium CG_4_10_14_0_2_um_filter_41_7]|uniref:Uncharacterized protein n=1 Tax=Candidatus Uhrbacteria bacterium CG_4_9_14_3_um_filter_41_35 TaxID=1975034 RepID=A0A2M7XF94_9BACT|nr:MAG: hypothetical protein COV92_00270 [Candidatus Uhrbacteria bacterium CG11_big_fil_rev_8_21_14_0_20_41_9]PIZ54449.1 MAG: hypothetical protein COY25_02110 [Candidatus Uhrbacteria bacterium CG_4_10_14_0_2_um_filter_41_7]PJA46522.1 MAG: hypothetical protein CO173_02030 [Candidatus Uhrbacteria bacterium CG_4_9_14_3_um_filter_41_35]
MLDSASHSERKVLLDCVKHYQEYFEALGVVPIEVSGDNKRVTQKELLGHCAGNLERIRAMINAGRLGDAKAIFCFMEGVLFATGLATLNDLRKLTHSI